MKKIITFTLVMLMCFILVGCGNKENIDPNNEQNKTPNTSELSIGKYKVEKKGNSVLVITNDGSAISTTEYKFTNNALKSATVIQKYSSTALAKKVYEEMKKESAITNQYVEMNIKGDTVSMTIKNEILSAYNGMDIDIFYELMESTYKAYME